MTEIEANGAFHVVKICRIAESIHSHFFNLKECRLSYLLLKRDEEKHNTHSQIIKWLVAFAGLKECAVMTAELIKSFSFEVKPFGNSNKLNTLKKKTIC